jgi:N-acetylmuramoyl-L-alanine amidase
MKNKFKLVSILGIVSIFLLVAFKPLNEKKVIVIDAGHGGKDFGATAGEVMEKEIVDKIANKIKTLNKDENIEIVLLREGDNFLELKERVEKINSLNPNLVISLHLNMTKNESTNGVEAFVAKDSKFFDESFKHAEGLINEVSNNNLAKRSVKEASLFLLKNSNCPAVNLEVGFMSNPKEREYLISEKGQNEIASNVISYLKKF